MPCWPCGAYAHGKETEEMSPGGLNGIRGGRERDAREFHAASTERLQIKAAGATDVQRNTEGTYSVEWLKSY